MSQALISAETLRWARERSEMNAESLAHKIPVKIDKILKWESGELKPTFKQAQKIANALHIPFGYLYLPTPPPEKLQIPDLRTIRNHRITKFSIDLKDVISNTIRKQDWYRDYLIEQGNEKILFIGRFSIDDNVETIANDIISTVGISLENRDDTRNWEEFLQLLMKRLEEIGVMVIRTGMVGSNTHRVLNVEEFRGFAIHDDYAPVIFLNGSDSRAAQIFTLMHEAAHLWLGCSGVSRIDLSEENTLHEQKIEEICNNISAEVLVPGNDLVRMWDSEDPVSNNTQTLSRVFKVSQVVIGRRAFDLKLIGRSEFFEFYLQQKEQWRQFREKRGDGGSYYRTIPVANGRNFTEAVLLSVESQSTLAREGAQLLGIKTSNLDALAAELGIR